MPPPPHPTIAIFKNVRFTGTVFGPQAYTYTLHIMYIYGKVCILYYMYIYNYIYNYIYIYYVF